MKSKRLPEEHSEQPILPEIDLTTEDWDDFERAVKLFNEGKFRPSLDLLRVIRERHEEDGQTFFDGLIRLVTAYHALQVNPRYSDVLENLDGAREALSLFQPEYAGLHIKPLLRLVDVHREEVKRLGAGGLRRFTWEWTPKLHFQRPRDANFAAEVASILQSGRFQEGVRLFNQGYHWEAHEVWEEVWRAEDGDTKTFVQAFVQMAAGFSFVKLHKLGSAKYLFEKSIEKFQKFPEVESPYSVRELVDTLSTVLTRIHDAMRLKRASVDLSNVPVLPTVG